MRPEDLVFWLDKLLVGSNEQGVLCRRHADTMVVPRGWTLDDLRDPDLHLFRPPTDDSGSIRRPRQRRSSSGVGHEQLALGVEPPTGEPDAAVMDAASPSTGPAGDEVAADETTADRVADTAADEAEVGDEAVEPWMPVFDTSDDLDGLLAARSPLLSRAFRGERSD